MTLWKNRRPGGRAARLRTRMLLVGGAILLLGAARAAWAQTSERIAPSAAYHAAFADFDDGDYKTALDRFTSEGRSAVKTVASRWIDSICYETMVGECYYHMGLFNKALAHYTNAVELYLAFPNWMVSVRFEPINSATTIRQPVPWAARPMQGRLGRYPMKMLIGQGQIDVNETVKRGGVVQQAQFYPIEPQEIVRATTLAIRRRAQLLGPMAAHDPLFENLIAVLSRRPGPPNHWSEAWINTELGLALAAGGRDAQAVAVLQKATVAAGEFVHPLSSVAHLELGRLAAARGDFVIASQHFEEASYAAYYYPDAGVLEEAFRYGMAVHLVARRKGMFPPLLPALQWARTKGLRQFQVSLMLLAAENQLAIGQVAPAAALTEEARGVIGRRNMGFGRIGARRSFLSAAALFRQGKVAEGEAALAAAMTYMRQGSYWLFHISLADNYFASGAAGAGTARTAVELFQTVLRDPQPADWSADPMESLAVMTTPHPLIYEHWFEAALARKERDLALEVADRARRHRYLSTLALGGRLEALRWVLEAPKERLPPQALLERQELLQRYPQYDQFRQQIEQLRTQLAAKPPATDDAEALRALSLGLQQLGAMAVRQRAMLYDMAVGRDGASLAFPPVRPTAEIQRSLPKGHALLVFFATSKATYGFLLDKDRSCDWLLSATTSTLGKQTVALLREMGNHTHNYELTPKDFAETKWKHGARELLDTITKGSRADFTTKFEELVIVPDGVLWYVPFEALQVHVDGQSQSLINRFRIRYVPTASLATSPPGWGRRVGHTVVVEGKLSPRLEAEVTQQAVTQLTKALPGTVSVRPPLPAPAASYAALVSRAVVLDDLSGVFEQLPYGWAPLPADRSKGGTLADWMTMPWQGPEEIILPGFHTGCEDALKRVSRTAPGSEMFLTACGLMSTGARTILLSRWRTGGQTSLDLVREFTQELPHTAPSDSLQRAITVVASSQLNPDVEPRVKRVANEEPPRANHPLFWAGYMLIDCGPAVAADPAAAGGAPLPGAKVPDLNPLMPPVGPGIGPPPKLKPEGPVAPPEEPKAKPKRPTGGNRKR